MRRIGLVLLLLLAWTAAAAGEEITFKDYGGTLTVAADAQQIDLGKLKVDNFDAFEQFLDRLPDLRRVDMYATHMGRKRVERLSERYPQIEFGWTLSVGEHSIRTDQTAFSTLHDGYVTRHTSKELEVLRYCRHLRALDLGHNALTDISFLAELTELRVLILADNRIEDISPLAGMEQLEYVELFRNRVKSLEPLAGKRQLMDLSINQNRLTSLEPLQEMPWLRRLWLRACGNEETVLSPAALEALQAALPQTQIDAVSLGTDGGWRSHPHYDVVYEMFKGKTYLPFEDSAAAGEQP